MYLLGCHTITGLLLLSAVLKAGIKASRCELSLFEIVIFLTNLITFLFDLGEVKFTLENVVL